MKKMIYTLFVIALVASSSALAAKVTTVALSYQDNQTVARIDVEGAIRYAHQTEVPKDGKGHRLIVDVLAATHALSAKTFDQLPVCQVTAIRTSQYSVQPEKVVRVVFDVTKAPLYRVEQKGNSIYVYFTDNTIKPFASWSSSNATPTPSKPTPAPATASVTPKPAPTTVASKPEEQRKTAENDRLASLSSAPTTTAPAKPATPTTPTTEVKATTPAPAAPATVAQKPSETVKPEPKPMVPATPKAEPKPMVPATIASNPPAKPAENKPTTPTASPTTTPKPSVATTAPTEQKPVAPATVTPKPAPSTTTAATKPATVASTPTPTKPTTAPATVATKPTSVQPTVPTAPKTEVKPSTPATTPTVAVTKPATTPTTPAPAKPAATTPAPASTKPGTPAPAVAKVDPTPTKPADPKANIPSPDFSSDTVAEEDLMLAVDPLAPADEEDELDEAGMPLRPNDTSSTARFRRNPAQAAKFKGTMIAEFPKRLVIKYEKKGRRDPFATLIDDSRSTSGPTEKLIPNIDGLRLVGVIEATGPGGNRALFEDKDGYSYILESGDKVQKGYVLRIEDNTVYFQIFEYGWTRTVSLKMEEI